MFCHNCGHRMEDNSDFCPECGFKRENSHSLAPQGGQPVIAGKSKRKSRFLKRLLVFFIVVAVVITTIYFIVPGVSKPIDLSIKASKEAYEAALSKLDFSKDNSPEAGDAEDYKYVYGDLHEIEVSLTSEELTSFFNINRPKYYALKNVQVRVNKDDTIETSATINTSYVLDKVLGGEYDREDVRRVMPMLGLLPENINIYCRFSGEIENNSLNELCLYNASVMGIPIPQSLLSSSDSTSFVKETINNYISRITEKSNTKYEAIKAANESIVIKGQIPSSLSRIPLR
ncbi:MAG: zinc ribbon domain-containing protein [Bacillota bacterium]